MESTEGTRARRAVPSRATERRAWGGAVGPRGRSVHGQSCSRAFTSDEAPAQRWAFNLTSPISTRRFPIFTEQVIDRQGRPWAKSAKIGCSADQVYSHRRQYADNWRPSCSCAARSAGRMASNIATGALSRTHASPAGAWCSGTCCTWARSTTLRNWRGGGRSRFWRMAPRDRGHCRCFRKTASRGCWWMPRLSASDYRNCVCAGRGSGARAGWH